MPASPATGNPYRTAISFPLPLLAMLMQLLDGLSRLSANASDIDSYRRAGEGIPRLSLVPLSAGGVWGLGVSTVLLAVCWMTTRIFAYHYAELMEIKLSTTNLLLGRNLLLAVLWALMLSLPPGEKQEPSTTRPEAS